MKSRRLSARRLLVVMAATLGPWVVGGACSFDWDSFDPRLEATATSVDAVSVASQSTGAGASTATGPGAGGAGGATGTGGSVVHVTAGLVALYTFEEGTGNIVGDVGGVGTPLDLTIADPANTNWVAGGLEITATTIVASSGPATKIIDACKQSGELTAEIWFVPANLTQAGPARLLTNSVDTGERNFTLGQSGDFIEARFRTDGVDGGLNGTPYLDTMPSSLAALLTHLLFTRDASGTRRLYMGGVELLTDNVPGALTSWSDTYGFAVANEFTLDRTWLGQIFRVAIYNRALSAAEVTQNYTAGP